MALPLLAPVVASLLGGLQLIAGSLVARVLVALGISVITFTGAATTLDWLKGEAVQNFSGLPVQVIGMLSVMKVGNCISMIFSAMVARQVQQGLGGDTFKRWIKK